MRLGLRAASIALIVAAGIWWASEAGQTGPAALDTLPEEAIFAYLEREFDLLSGQPLLEELPPLAVDEADTDWETYSLDQLSEEAMLDYLLASPDVLNEPSLFPATHLNLDSLN